MEQVVNDLLVLLERCVVKGSVSHLTQECECNKFQRKMVVDPTSIYHYIYLIDGLVDIETSFFDPSFHEDLDLLEVLLVQQHNEVVLGNL